MTREDMGYRKLPMHSCKYCKQGVHIIAYGDPLKCALMDKGFDDTEHDRSICDLYEDKREG